MPAAPPVEPAPPVAPPAGEPFDGQPKKKNRSHFGQGCVQGTSVSPPAGSPAPSAGLAGGSAATSGGGPPSGAAAPAGAPSPAAAFLPPPHLGSQARKPLAAGGAGAAGGASAASPSAGGWTAGSSGASAVAGSGAGGSAAGAGSPLSAMPAQFRGRGGACVRYGGWRPGVQGGRWGGGRWQCSRQRSRRVASPGRPLFAGGSGEWCSA